MKFNKLATVFLGFSVSLCLIPAALAENTLINVGNLDVNGSDAPAEIKDFESVVMDYHATHRDQVAFYKLDKATGKSVLGIKGAPTKELIAAAKKYPNIFMLETNLGYSTEDLGKVASEKIREVKNLLKLDKNTEIYAAVDPVEKEISIQLKDSQLQNIATYRSAETINLFSSPGSNFRIIYTGNKTQPILKKEDLYGGGKLSQPGTPSYCTTAFSVYAPNKPNGLLTAAHCFAMPNIVDICP